VRLGNLVIEAKTLSTSSSDYRDIINYLADEYDVEIMEFSFQAVSGQSTANFKVILDNEERIRDFNPQDTRIYRFRFQPKCPVLPFKKRLRIQVKSDGSTSVLAVATLIGEETGRRGGA
jgi:hypothetical protein